MAALVEAASSSVITASGAVVTGASAICAVLASSAGTGVGNVVVYDGTSASGTAKVRVRTANSAGACEGITLNSEVRCVNGIYVTLTNITCATVVFKRLNVVP